MSRTASESDGTQAPAAGAFASTDPAARGTPLRARTIAACAASLCLLLGAAAATAQSPGRKELPPALDLREKVERVAVTVTDMYGRRETREIPVVIYRPEGERPGPLAVFLHGRANRERRAEQGRARPERLARWLAQSGFVVAVPTRVGYADTYGDFDPEYSGGCRERRIRPMNQAIVDQTLAVVAHMSAQPYVDAGRWIVIGQSVGGQGAVAVVGAAPEGLVAGINFAGGSGGHPQEHPRRPCGAQLLKHEFSALGAKARVPMLWLYWENDLFWGSEHPREWFSAWREAGGAGTFHLLSPVGEDGHQGINLDMDRWVPLAQQFLSQVGFAVAGPPERPAASGFARVDDVSRVPLLDERAREEGYLRFLKAQPPRAFAIGDRGGWGWGQGDWAIGKALGNCARYGQRCTLYAVDDVVVWK